jgi:L-seryl-tRNA(Ser) seleniumtransferase
MELSDQQILRKIPSVDALLGSEEFASLKSRTPYGVLVMAVRGAVDEVRKTIRGGSGGDMDEEGMGGMILEKTQEHLDAALKPHYRKVVNATGVILHTALGRAALPERAVRQIVQEMSGYSLLQMDLETGGRSVRDERIEYLLQQLTGCEAATVVNNNAAATSLMLNSMAAGKEVIVSRGQLVEIGGSFRLPEVMAASGAKLVEVGATNKTHGRDYENAITENTAALLRVHPSNYKIVGFSSEVSLEDMAAIAQEHNLVLIDDVGAGALIDFSRFGFDYEPTLLDSVRGGADVISCSADKLIGAGQGGIILGKAEHIKKIRKNPLARMMRVDKLTLAVLEATLTLFLDEETALAEVPTLAMLQRGLPELSKQAEKIVRQLKGADIAAEIEDVAGFSEMGSGSLPTQGLPTRLVAVRPKRMSVDRLLQGLRKYQPPIIARIEEEQVLLDPRTLQKGEDKIIVEALAEILKPSGGC